MRFFLSEDEFERKQAQIESFKLLENDEYLDLYFWG